jgi:hypothetical protein
LGRVGFNEAKQSSCKRSAFDGVDLVQRVRGHWRYVTAGSAELPCRRLRVPVAVSRDLRLPCAVTIPTGPLGAQRLQTFLSPDQKIWCVSGGGVPGSPFACAARPGENLPFPQFSAELSNSGNVTICSITHLIQEPGQPPDTCFENWDSQAPVLRIGKQNFVDGVLCKSQTSGITCTLTVGAEQGKGFFINSTSVRRVGGS